MIFALGVVAAWACDDVGTEARSARDRLLAMEREQAGAALARARAALACDPVDETELAVLYLVEAAFRTFGGDRDGARALFSAASRVAPEVWLVDLGEELQASYREARLAPVPEGEIVLEGVPAGAEVRVDGAPADGTRFAGGGTRTVQVVRGGEVIYGVMRPVEGSVLLRVRGAFEVTPTPRPTPSPSVSDVLAAHVALGGELVLGAPVSAEGRSEDGVRVSVPLELGARVRVGSTWWRPAVGIGRSLGSSLLFTAGDEVRATATILTGTVAGGVGLGRVDLGLQAGVWLPGRQSLRAVAGARIWGPLWAESRVGAHRVGGRPLEPIASLWLVVAPPVR